MAKKRRTKVEKKDKGPAFRFPEFDRDKFMEDEVRGARTTFVAAGLGLVWGIIAALVMAGQPTLWPGLFVAGILFGSLMRLFFRAMKIDMEELGWKGQAGSFAVYFFMFVSVWILLINPPFADLQSPLVDELEIHYQQVNATGAPVNASWVAVEESEGTFPGIPRPVNIMFRAKVLDNDGVDEDSVTLEILHQGQVLLTGVPMESVGDHWFEAVIEIHDPMDTNWRYSQYDFKVFADDINGHSSSGSASVFFSEWE